MSIFEEKSISRAKQELPSIVREASKGYEVIACNFKSRKRDRVSIISTDLFEEIINNAYKLEPVVEKDSDGKGYTISLDNLLLHGEGTTLYEALKDLADNLADYASDYLGRIDFFRQIENRKGHYPYLRRIAGCPDINSVMEVIAECHTGLQQEISNQLQKD